MQVTSFSSMGQNKYKVKKHIRKLLIIVEMAA